MSSVSISVPSVSKLSLFSTGMALFSMFFGAGNLIFPLIIGRMAGDQFPAALWGLGISAVAFPFLGLMAMMLYGGDIALFLSRFGKWPSFLILFCLQMSQGPLGAMPRLVTLMHASVKPYIPELSLWVFSPLACGLIFFLSVRKQKIVEILGSILTPFLILTLAALIGVALFLPTDPICTEKGVWSFFGLGVKMGYQTTDLLAALLFATLVLPHLARGTEQLCEAGRRKVIRQRMLGASSIAAGLLMLAYVGLCWLSANLGADLKGLNPEDLLYALSVRVLGPFGGVVSTIAVFLACLTTAISLGAVFADYLKVLGGYKRALALTLGLTGLTANLGFNGIVQIWGPILDVLYPILIGVCLYNIFRLPEKAASQRTP